MKEIQQLQSIIDTLEADSKDVGQFKDVYKKLESSLFQLKTAKSDIENVSKNNENFVAQSQERFIDILKNLNELKDTTTALQKLEGVISSEITGLEKKLKDVISSEVTGLARDLKAKTSEQTKEINDQFYEHLERVKNDNQRAYERLIKLVGTSIVVSIFCCVALGLAFFQIVK